MAAVPSAPNLYEDPARFRFVGSMEGVPDAPLPAQDDTPRWRSATERSLDTAARVMPGVAIAGVLAFAAVNAMDAIGRSWLGFEKSPLPPALAAIALGLLIRNGLRLPDSYDEGLRFCVQRLLRVGVALLGLRLSLGDVGAIGLGALPIVTACIATALVGVTLANRWLGLPARLGTLIAVGTAICGNSAIAATGPAIGAKEDEVAYAVACITLFGLFALLVYPFAASALFTDPHAAGLFLGAAIHDTAQVAGAGMLASQHMGDATVLDTAAVTKLLRNAFMLVVIPGAAWMHHRNAATRGPIRAPRWNQAVPLFVLGFLGLALLRTLGDMGGQAPFGGLLSVEGWGGMIESAANASAALLVLAMAAIGLGTDLRRLRGLGLRPMAVGLVAALAVGGTAALGIAWLTPWLATLPA